LEGSEAGCERIDLRPAPRWSLSGAWSEDGLELLLVDVFGPSIRRYASDGRYLGEAARPASGPLSYSHPTEIRPLTGGGFLLLNGPTQLLRLDRALVPNSLYDLHGWTVEWQGGKGTIGGLSHLAVLGGKLVGLAPLLSDAGVVYAVVEPDLELGEPVPGTPWPAFGRAEERYASAVGPLMATAGEQAFLLTLWEDELVIRKVRPPGGTLSAFPPGFSAPPDFPESRGAESTAAVFASMEELRFPRGLFGRGEFLYVLTREPGKAGTVWRLHQIDPGADRLTRSMVLPTKANHLFLVPGPKHWALVEKGPVAGPGRQAIPSAVLVPSAWIEDPASQVLAGEEPPACGAKGASGGDS
jgi:hypothetical protein